MLVTASTPLIDTNTNQYPLYLHNLRQSFPNVSFAREPDSDSLVDFNHAVVQDTEKPEGDVITEGVPELIGGEYFKTWVTRAFTTQELADQLDVAKASLLRDIDTLLTTTIETGFSYDFPDATTQHVQLRDGDRANLAGLRIQADELKAASITDPVFEFRTFENNNIMLTPDEMIVMSKAAVIGYMAILKAGWTLKDEVKDALTIAALPALPAQLVTV